jgi:hypothetical protein
VRLEEFAPGVSMTGVEPALVVSVRATVPMGDGAVRVVCRTQRRDEKATALVCQPTVNQPSNGRRPVLL